MNTQDIISSGILEMYAAGNTSAEENALVKTYIATYPEVKNELHKIEEALEQYAFANAVQPKIKVQHKLFSLLNFEEQKEIKQTPVLNITKLKAIAAAAVVLFAISALFNILFYKKYKELNNFAENTSKELKLLREEEIEDDAEIKIVQSKYNLPLKLNGSELSPGADAKIFWLTNTGEIYLDARNMPPTPPGKQYQLWAIVNGKAIDAGLITSPDGHTFRMQKMKTFGKAEAFAITLEVTGGVIASKEKPFAIVKL